jgi:hypothetical protein
MGSNSEIFTIVLVFLGITFFICLWFGIIGLSSLISGWNRLSKRYPFKEKNKEPDKKKSFQSAQIGVFNYNGILTLSFYPDGLAIEVMILFSFKHPKLFIPWKEIKLKEKSKSFFFWNKFEIGNPVIATISVNDKNLEDIKHIKI